MAARILSRTIDGTIHVSMTCSSVDEALDLFRRWAEEAVANGFRRVRLSEDEGILVLSYGGDDTVTYYIEEVVE